MLSRRYPQCMMESCVNELKGFLMKPVEAFKQTNGKSLGCAYQYYVVLLIVFGVLFTIVAVSLGVAQFSAMVNMIATIPWIGGVLSGTLAHFTGFVATWLLFASFAIFFMLLFGIFLFGFFFHVFVLLFGGEQGVTQTVKTTMYAATPALLLGWIPYIWVIGLIWAVVLFIIGISENQKISIGRAIAVIIVPLILKLILIGLGAAVIGSFIGAIAGLIPNPF
jgi:hypothetical protein